MENNCQNIQEQILELITGVMSPEKTAELQRHIDSCPSCSKYLQALQADDKLLGNFAETMQPRVARVENNVIGALNLEPSTGQVKCISGWRKIMKGPIIRIAAAAMLLIVAGYVVGRVTAPRPIDVQKLRAEMEASLKSFLEPAIRRDVLERVKGDWQLAFTNSYLQLRSELDQRFRDQLDTYAVRTLAASNIVTNRLLAELIQSINAAQKQEHRWFATALEQVELNRVRDTGRLREDFASFAVQAGDQVQRNRDDIVRILGVEDNESVLPNKLKDINK